MRTKAKPTCTGCGPDFQGSKGGIWGSVGPKPNLVWEWIVFCTGCKHHKTEHMKTQGAHAGTCPVL